MSHINFFMKLLGQRSAGKPHAALDVAGAGDVLSGNAPVFDPTLWGGAGNGPSLDSGTAPVPYPTDRVSRHQRLAFRYGNAPVTHQYNTTP